ncbi:MAG: dCTP deaminase [archaeon]
MILSNEDIKKHLAKGTIKIDPAPSDDQIGSASVDFTLSNEFYKVRKEYIGKKVEMGKLSYEDVTEKVIADEITIKHHDLILGKTVEKITLPADIAGRIEGRSSVARLGIAIHVASGFIQPGSDNHQVLEIVNLSPYAVKIKAGTKICQIIFETLKSKSSKPYAKFGRVAVNQ